MSNFKKMNINRLKIIPTNLLPLYLEEVKDLKTHFEALQDAELSTHTFSFYTSVASVFSSKIEGEAIELDSYVKHKRFGMAFLPDYTQKIDDLYDAYTFAQTYPLNSENIAKAHVLLTQHILTEHYQGIFRTQNMYVTTTDGRIEYVATSPFEVQNEMQKLYEDIEILLTTELTIEETFFFASFIHLIFVKIHPWNDGNGRCARLLEKWFLAEKLGEKAWFIQSEKHYYQQHDTYYHHIRLLGLEYDELDYGKALPFCLLLVRALFIP
jgi:Fic family protein